MFDLLRHGVQVFGFLVVALKTVAAHAPALAKQIFALAESPAHVARHQHHVRGVAGLTAGLDVWLREKGPEPMLIISVRFLNAGGGPSIPLVTRRTAELVRIVGLQQFRSGMAGERPGIIVGLFPF